MKKIMMSFALVSAFVSSSSFAALNSYLEIKNSKGVSQVVTCPDGACSVSGLTADTYTITVVDAQGKPVSLDSAKYTCSVVSPRDAASGLPTGKRMHKPFEISKEMRTSDVVIEQDESSLAITCTSSNSITTTSHVSSGLTAATAIEKTSTYDLKEARK